MLFCEYGGNNFSVTNCMSHSSMFVSTKAILKLANGNTGYVQVIGVILYHFPNLPIICPVGPLYSFPGDRSNAISLGALKFYVGFQNITSEPLEHCYFFNP